MTTTRERNASKQYRNAETRSVDAERRTVEIVWSTGAAVLRRDVFGSFWEELSLNPAHVRLERLNNRAPFLANHNQADVRQVLGVVVPGSAKVDGKQGIATIRFSKAGIDPEADKVFEKIRDGILTKVSVGYATHAEEEMEPDAKGIPTLRATDWEPFEISSVAVGADDGATFRSTPNQPERKHMEPDVKPKSPTEVDIVERERARAHAINHAVRVAHLDPSYADEMIRAGTPLEVARERVLAAMEARSAEINPTPGGTDLAIEREMSGRVSVGNAPEDHFVRGGSAALWERTGKRGLLQKAKDAKVSGFETIETDGGRFRGMSTYELAKESLRLRGVRVPFDSTKVIGDALQHRTGLGMQGTADFGVLLENVLNKILMASAALAPQVWRTFCAEMDVNDFKSTSLLQTGALGILPVVKEHEEYKNIQIPDATKIEISTETRGGIIGLSRQALVNDDLGQHANMAQQLGLAATRSIESAAFALLLQNSGLGPTFGGQPFFHSSRGNVGSAAALSVTSLDADRVLMSAQKDANGVEPLDLRPSVLLVSSAIGGLARATIRAELEPEVLQMPNRAQNIAQVVDTGRLTGTRRYLFADPNICPAFAVVFLNESRTPYFERQDGFRVDGVEFKVRHDFKAVPIDPRGAVTNAGA